MIISWRLSRFDQLIAPPGGRQTVVESEMSRIYFYRKHFLKSMLSKLGTFAIFTTFASVQPPVIFRQNPADDLESAGT